MRALELALESLQQWFLGLLEREGFEASDLKSVRIDFLFAPDDLEGDYPQAQTAIVLMTSSDGTAYDVKVSDYGGTSETLERPGSATMESGTTEGAFRSTEALTAHEAFRAMRFFISRFASEAGDDITTLLGDTWMEPDGMPVDPAAWDDWLASIDKMRRGDPQS